MHSGPVETFNKPSNALSMVCLLLALLFTASCQDRPAVSTLWFKSPMSDQSLPLGQDIKVELDVPKGEDIGSVEYLIDGKSMGTGQGAAPFMISTKGLSVGFKTIAAIVDKDGDKDTLEIKVQMNSGLPPEEYAYKIVKEYPHDTSAYTQGLEYHNGLFLESTGQEGHSTLRWVEPASGKPVQMEKLADQYFGEGATLVGDKIVMLTWRSNMGFVYEAKTLKQLSTFPYENSKEGWGLVFDGSRLIKSDGTNRLYFLNKDTFKEEAYIDVYDNKGAVTYINELEYIDGKVYANVYQEDYIVVINPATGIVEKKINLQGLLSKSYFKDEFERANDVLNGIAWDKEGKRLFVTGKKWPKLFEIVLVPKK